MPVNQSANGVVATQSAPASSRFQLPALNLTFGSLTDGTDIPPPLPSPKEEQPPPVQPKETVKSENPVKKEVVAKKEEKEEKVEDQQPKAEPANGATNGTTTPRKPDIAITTNVGLKRPADEVPVSPVPSSRGSLRRLISKSLLNHAYDDQGSPTGQATSRPPSRTASLIADEKKAKRSSGWFRRLRSHDTANDSKPAPLQFESVNKKPSGPPPPMIPELSALETKIDTHLGDDLFKGIGRDL
ncbi:hypothetical protein F4859DRAFT_245691 [Xylaria cf. heliscus]|nr:hypothetical protein F4859DRAFT_245691 [Xylaria cf. heliscus]